MIKIIPEPKKIKIRSGRFIFEKKLKIFASPAHSNAVERLNIFCSKNFGFKLEHQHTGSEIAGLLIASKKEKTAENTIANKQGYTLDIDTSVHINGGSPQGVFYGTMTLIQLLQDSRELPLLKITDSPFIRLRAEHWDLKGLIPDFEYLKKRIHQLSEMKINALLVEYEDKFSFDKHPLIVNKNALTKIQVAELVKLAEKNFIQVIPLVQSLGHAEYVLRHKEYSHVAETDENCQQFCASTPRTLELFKDFMEEIMPLHPSKFVHVGGDETRQLGECPKCAAKVKEAGVMGLYFEHLEKVCRYVVESGKIPIIWDDMLCRNFRVDLIAKLPRETIFMPWLYSIEDEKSPIFRAPGHNMVYSGKFLHKKYDEAGKMEQLHFFNNQGSFPVGWVIGKEYEKLSDEEKSLMDKYAEPDKEGKYFNSAPAVNLIKEAGLDFIGAGALIASSDGSFIPKPESKNANLRAWAKITVKNNGIGVVGTGWARSGSLTEVNTPFEARWYPVTAMAEHFWAGGETDERLLDLKFNWRFFGIDGLEFTDALFMLHAVDGRFSMKAVNMLHALKKKITRNQDIFEQLLNAAELFHMDYFFRRVMENGFKKKYYLIKKGEFHSSMRKNYIGQLDEITSSSERLEARTEKLLSLYMPTEEVKEYTDSIFMPVKDSLACFKSMLQAN